MPQICFVMRKFILYFKTILKLGILNVLYVFWYRMSLKYGLRKFLFPQTTLKFVNDFFKASEIRNEYREEWKQQLLLDAEKIIHGQIRYYANNWKQVSSPPNWFLNPFNGAEYPNSNLHWSELPDFNPEAGDIKNIWEASRFEWLVTLARAYSITGEDKYLHVMNEWIKDWIEINPLNTGPNWKCGQETSIRVFNLLISTIILNQWNNPSCELTDLIYIHLQRILPNIRYAIVQDNNHGTSEAAALFIGGIWLHSFDNHRYPRAARYAKMGRKWLENRIHKLVETDGSFSQHSVNYHRVLLDTLSFTEYFRSILNEKPFSTSFYAKSEAAIFWLFDMCNEHNGNCPNLGSNDGALFLHMHACDYRDFRPSIQLAGMLYTKTRLFGKGKWDEPLFWLKPENKTDNSLQHAVESRVFKGGYTILKSNDTFVFIRWPNFKFRPAHNDVFHIDLWHKDKNILCDAGTYSYHPASDDATIDLSSVKHHNTISFDHAEPMPRIGRFLLGKWIKPEQISTITKEPDGSQSWSGSYHDAKGNRHERKIEVTGNNCMIYDNLSGSFNIATLGFNITEYDCRINDSTLQTSFGVIRFPDNAKSILVDAICSDYYMEKHLIKRLQLTVKKPGTYLTQIIFN